jgi:hypothetical protein
MVEDLQRIRINVNRLSLFLEIDVHAALAVRNGKFRSSTQVDRPHYFSISGVDDGGVVAVSGS